MKHTPGPSPLQEVLQGMVYRIETFIVIESEPAALTLTWQMRARDAQLTQLTYYMYNRTTRGDGQGAFGPDSFEPFHASC